jgi:molecular chaperone GrpE
MGKRSRKIKIASTEEVAEYGGSPGGESAGVDTPAKKEAPPTEPAEAQAPPQEQPADEVAELRARIEELNDRHLRAVAELRNFRRRADTENQEAVRYASADLIRALLPIMDDLERSLAAVPEDESSALAEGVRLVHQNLVKVLQTHHVERIESQGQPFDPSLHEAMMQQPSDEHPPSTVIEEYQSGYKLWDRVLRHAKVIVSKQSEGAAEVPGDRPETAPTETTEGHSR